MPGEPVDDRELPPPADPWATINRPAPTVHLGGPDTTAHVGGADKTVSFGPAGRPAHQPGPNPNQHIAPVTPTMHAGAPDAPTFRASTPDPPTFRAGMPDAPTMRAGRPDPTALRAGMPDAPTVRAHNEVRFGPGVPVPVPAAPAWPGPAKRPRSPWRRLVSVLSSLLTLALLVVVGLYLWQRLRPLEVESATVSVPRPAGNRCDVTVDVVATVRTNGRSGVIRYQWIRTGAAPGAVLTEQVGRGQRTALLTLKWTFSGVGTTTETATVNIVEPSPLQAGTQVAYRCQGG
ncbi:hypothetical protein ACQPZX_28695 [Actinoplanes sp. CA-142083]|uniref:hypothetical protein n=1 Tax=Actinoplanes sp. CA-142083 TaxID=3239903 RepID=UPI003D8F9651